ncbi:three-Cys-motif partner protein TcmP [Desulfobulbus sp. F1]|nr:three-Cys-motif partner protein TcmP [Desulfobulbus sp. F1]
MSKHSQKYTWDSDKRPHLEEHSEAKHAILSGYIRKYLNIVCQDRKIRQYNITLVDGFAGGGIYQHDKPGSPLVMINAVKQADIEINKDRSRHVKIDPNYFFIENKRSNYNSLKDAININYIDDQSVVLRHGDFNVYLDEIIAHIKKRNPRDGGGSIFFLDQSGYSSVSVDALKRIRKELPNAEVIINISISWMVDFINDSNRFKSIISNMGLENFVNFREIIELKENIGENRYIIESKLSVALQRAAEFPFFRPFFIEPCDNHRGYWLLHLSPHYRAHNAMSEVIWEQGNCMRHYGGDGARIFDLSYKGGTLDRPNIFGKTFNGTAREQHVNGLIRDIPSMIWSNERILVARLIESTCNNTAASQDMYKESLLKIRNQGDVVILGKSGGRKRTDKISSSDIILPNKQCRIFI